MQLQRNIGETVKTGFSSLLIGACSLTSQIGHIGKSQHQGDLKQWRPRRSDKRISSLLCVACRVWCVCDFGVWVRSTTLLPLRKQKKNCRECVCVWVWWGQRRNFSCITEKVRHFEFPIALVLSLFSFNLVDQKDPKLVIYVSTLKVKKRHTDFCVWDASFGKIYGLYGFSLCVSVFGGWNGFPTSHGHGEGWGGETK